MEKKYKKILFDLADSVSLNDSIANEYLVEQGIETSAYTSKILNTIKRKEFFLKAEQNIQKHQELIEKALKKLKNAIPETITNIENAIRLKNPAFQFRNLQELDEPQLREILEDVDLINLIEQLDTKE